MKLEELFETKEQVVENLDRYREDGIEVSGYLDGSGVRISHVNFDRINIDFEDGFREILFDLRREFKKYGEIPEDIDEKLWNAFRGGERGQGLSEKFEAELQEIGVAFRSILKGVAVKYAETKKKHAFEIVEKEIKPALEKIKKEYEKNNPA